MHEVWKGIYYNMVVYRPVPCLICGELFIPTNSRSKHCCKPIELHCVICGTSYTGRCHPQNSRTCSKKCAGQLIANTRVFRDKRICEKCGKEFIPASPTQKYCKDVHLQECVICHSVFPLKTRNRMTCSDSCEQQLRESTTMLRTGFKYPGQSTDAKDKIKQTNVSKYGVENPMQSMHIREKHASAVMRNYGVENPIQHPEINDRAQAASMTDPSKYDNYKQLKTDVRAYILSHYDHLPSLEELAYDTGARAGTVGMHVQNQGCQDLITFVRSYMEKHVMSVIAEIDPNANVITNTRAIITPYELDFYLPDYSLAIECNPTSTHNSSIGWESSSVLAKPYDYHKMKSDLCQERGIFLFHIFGHEWEHKRDIIISMLRNLMNKNLFKVYGRDTYVKSVDVQAASSFLNANHRQGSAVSSVRLGLYTKVDDRLVSLMTFGKIRHTIGKRSLEENRWELVRFCSKLNTTVVGGASKLFKHFVDNYQFDALLSYSDVAHTRGDLYRSLGFHAVRRSRPGYVWIDTKTNVAYHRVNAQKRNIRRFLHDNTIDLSRTERDIMESFGYVRVYGSGTVVWEYQHKSRNL